MFKIHIKDGDSKQALTYVLAWDKRFTGHRFLLSTGIEVTRRGFDPANLKKAKLGKDRPGKALENWLKDAKSALESLEREGAPVNNSTLKARIELIRDRIAWNDNELTIWDKSTASVKAFTIPEGVDRLQLKNDLNKELEKARPDLKRAVEKVVGGGSGELLGFFADVIAGKIKPIKGKRKGKALKPASIRAKRQSLNALIEFQDYRNEPITFASMDLRFYSDFTTWLQDKKNYDPNSQGKIIKDLKSVLNLAKAREVITDDRFSSWPVTREKNEVVTLTKEELLHINDLREMKIFDAETGKVVEVRLLSDTEQNVRDIFVLACFVGARIGDYKQFKRDNLSTRAGIMYFTHVQEKTGKLVEIPIHDMARKVLEKRGGEFPRMISEQNFRYILKDICRSVGMNDRVIIKIRDDKPQYKKKWEAISPHSARRTFASNLFYGWFGKPMPASLCMRFTGHKSEKTFMLYIGASEEDLNKLALQYFDFKPQMSVSK